MDARRLVITALLTSLATGCAADEFDASLPEVEGDATSLATEAIGSGASCRLSPPSGALIAVRVLAASSSCDGASLVPYTHSGPATERVCAVPATDSARSALAAVRLQTRVALTCRRGGRNERAEYRVDGLRYAPRDYQRVDAAPSLAIDLATCSRCSPQQYRESASRDYWACEQAAHACQGIGGMFATPPAHARTLVTCIASIDRVARQCLCDRAAGERDLRARYSWALGNCS